MLKVPLSSLKAEILPLLIALDIVAFDFPVAFAASPRVYTLGFPVVHLCVQVNVNRFLFVSPDFPVHHVWFACTLGSLGASGKPP